MASDADILAVRQNTNEPVESSTYTDEDIGELVDAGSVESASATIWRHKAAVYSELYNQSEAGASVAMGDVYKHAKEMADFYASQVPGMQPDQPRAKVTKITRVT